MKRKINLFVVVFYLFAISTTSMATNLTSEGRAGTVVDVISEGAKGASTSNDFALNLLRIHYQDSASRHIDYDFSSGLMDSGGTITIPNTAVIQRPVEETDTVYLWEQRDDLNGELEDGFQRLSLPHPETDMPPVPVAQIVVDGNVEDWAMIEPYLVDENTDEDEVSLPGTDIQYVKLAYSQEGERLNILIKVADAVQDNVRYRMFFDHKIDDKIDGPCNRQVDFVSNGMQWDVVSQGWNSQDGWDWYPVEEDGQIVANGSFLEGSVDISSLGIGPHFYFLGRTMEPANPIYPYYYSYDWFYANRWEPEGLFSLGAGGPVVQAPSNWEFECRLSGFHNVQKEQCYFQFRVGAGRSEDQYQDTSTQHASIIVDGNALDWSSVEPAVIVSEDESVSSPSADIQRVCTAMDDDFFYFMIQTAAPLAGSDIRDIEANFNYRSGQHSHHGPWDDLHTNVHLESQTLSAWTGDMVPVSIDAVIQVDEVLEVAIARSDLEEDGYFNATFVNTWKQDSVQGKGEDPTWVDPKTSPKIQAAWFTGFHDGQYYENVLALKGEINVGDGILNFEGDHVFLTGLDPKATTVDAKIEVQNGATVHMYYRINDETWQTLWQYTISGDRMPGFPGLFPYLSMESGYVYFDVPGDFDGDDMVALSDLAILASAWMADSSQPQWNPICDLNCPGDGRIDMFDFAKLAAQWETFLEP